MPENWASGKGLVSWDILASDNGRMAGPPRPPEETRPSTFISKSSVAGSISGIDGKVFDEAMASAPPRNEAPASSTMLAVAGVSFTQTGIFDTSFTACVTTEQRTLSLPTFEPMSTRSMCGQEKFSSSASHPSSCIALVSVCQLCSSLSWPEPAMIEATSIFFGYAFLILLSFPIHQSRGLPEISSQFHDATSVDSGPLALDTREPLLSARKNFVFGPLTFTTGCRPMVFVTTPPQPASKARRMLLSDSVGGADAS